ncbi:L,D-transpeptidase family protein [Prosthecobacter sp.]|uniref:L,D-transpeptidase family protein n=1 Tax=Prosthecobacter sp. TaxID=1965333 RepID=UPI003784C689
MKPTLTRMLLLALAGLAWPLPRTVTAADAPPATLHAGDREAATRLQVFLDRANFGPGKIDGRFGGFSEKALGLYREAHGLPALPAAATAAPASPKEEGKPEKTVALPDLSDMDLSSVKEVFVDYTVTEADVKATGKVPKAVPEQAKLKWLPYETVAEAVAERYHVDVDYLKELNPGKVEALKAGDVLKVPNVEPFDLAGVKALPLLDVLAEKAQKAEAKAAHAKGKEKGGKKAQGEAGKKDGKAKGGEVPPPPQPKPEGEEKGAKTAEAAPTAAVPGMLSPEEIALKVDTKDNMLRLFEKGKLVAAYPVTIGSAQTESPLGEWKVKGVALLPNFRYDLSFLKTGERSSKTHLLPPGPNNPVGVVWVALDKPGIGLHGTSDPDAIGRSASHGCIRLANWDIVRLATRVRAGVAVSIH